jgi:hypothetical protein
MSDKFPDVNSNQMIKVADKLEGILSVLVGMRCYGFGGKQAIYHVFYRNS